ncbi:MAG TPA: hypothetical protein VIL43_11985 [Burkholderiales bacterium]
MDAMQRARPASSAPGSGAGRAGAEALRVERAALSRSAPPDYSLWSLEELRAFAIRMQLPGAASKSRQELLEIFMPRPPRSSSAA